jgi:4-oxalocrotonate tautomerase
MRPMCGELRGPSMTGMPLIQVKLIEGLFTGPQKREIVERLSETMIEIAGESMRHVTSCIVEEVASGEWSIGGQTVTADDLRALASGEPEGG